MTSNYGHASTAVLEVCLRCEKSVKGNEADCDLCLYWFHTKCEGVGADLYKTLQKFEEAVRVGRSNNGIKWYCDSCSITVEKVNGRLLLLEIGQLRLMDEMEKLREKMIQEMKKLKEELEEKLSGHKEEKGYGCHKGIQESEDMDEKVGMIMKELGFSKQYQEIKDIFIWPDLTRKQAEEDRKLRLKAKEIHIKREVLDGVKISKGRIVGRVDGHVIYDPSA